MDNTSATHTNWRTECAVTGVLHYMAIGLPRIGREKDSLLNVSHTQLDMFGTGLWYQDLDVLTQPINMVYSVLLLYKEQHAALQCPWRGGGGDEAYPWDDG